jgi:hypothetical protein
MRDEGAQPAVEGPIDLERAVPNATGKAYTVRELRSRVSLHEPRIVLLREVEGGTRETLDLIGETILELTRALPAWGMVVDLADAVGNPTADYRSYIPQFFTALHGQSGGRLRQVAIAFVGNPVARVVTQFVMSRFTRVPVSIQKNRAQAIDVVRRTLQGHA